MKRSILPLLLLFLSIPSALIAAPKEHNCWLGTAVSDSAVPNCNPWYHDVWKMSMFVDLEDGLEAANLYIPEETEALELQVGFAYGVRELAAGKSLSEILNSFAALKATTADDLDAYKDFIAGYDKMPREKADASTAEFLNFLAANRHRDLDGDLFDVLVSNYEALERSVDDLAAGRLDLPQFLAEVTNLEASVHMDSRTPEAHKPLFRTATATARHAAVIANIERALSTRDMLRTTVRAGVLTARLDVGTYAVVADDLAAELMPYIRICTPTEWTMNIGDTDADEVNGVTSRAWEAPYGGQDTYFATGSYLGVSVDEATFGDVTDVDSRADSRDIFIARITSCGDVSWVRTAGSTGNSDIGTDVAVHTNGRVVGVGYYSGSADFDQGSSTASNTLTSAGGTDGYVASYSSSGSLSWVLSLGGTGADRATDIAIGTDNAIYVVGTFSGTASFPSTDASPALTRTAVNGTDIFVVKYDQNGVAQWVRALTSVDWLTAPGVDIAPSGPVAVVGTYAADMTIENADDPWLNDEVLNTSNSKRNGFLVTYGDTGWISSFRAIGDKYGHQTADTVASGFSGHYFPCDPWWNGYQWVGCDRNPQPWNPWSYDSVSYFYAVAGTYDNGFPFDYCTALSVQSGLETYVAVYEQGSSWSTANPVSIHTIESAYGNVRPDDIDLSPGGKVMVTGHYQTQASLEDPCYYTGVPSPNATNSGFDQDAFIATYDLTPGYWVFLDPVAISRAYAFGADTGRGIAMTGTASIFMAVGRLAGGGGTDALSPPTIINNFGSADGYLIGGHVP